MPFPQAGVREARANARPIKRVLVQEESDSDVYRGPPQAHYTARKKDMPMGLNLASVDQLRDHYNEIKGVDPRL